MGKSQLENEQNGSPRKSVQKGEALWLMSFSDMSLSLLCFFVLMISTMKPHKEKFEHMKEGMVAEQHLRQADNLRTLAKKIKKVVKSKKLDKAASVTYDADGLHIEFKDGLIFQSGSARFQPKNNQTMQAIMRVIAKLGPKYRMVIEGHTDDTPLRGSRRYPSNWELSAARGFSLMRLFHKLGVAEDKVSVVAFAHTKPKVPYQNLKGEALRRARAANRRVVVWIE